MKAACVVLLGVALAAGCVSAEAAGFRAAWSEAQAQAARADALAGEAERLLAQENYEIACARLVAAEHGHRDVVQRLIGLRERLAESGLDDAARERFEMVDSDMEQSARKAGEADARWIEVCGPGDGYEATG